jgi:hypothetical protein
MTAVIALAAAAAYLFIGFRWSTPLFVKREMARNVEQYPTLAADPSDVKSWRREALGLGLLLAFVWPVYLIAVWVFSVADRHVPLSDLEAQRKIREQQAYIERLERETGIRP